MESATRICTYEVAGLQGDVAMGRSSLGDDDDEEETFGFGLDPHVFFSGFALTVWCFGLRSRRYGLGVVQYSSKNDAARLM